MYQDRSKEGYIGNGQLDAVQVAKMGFGDTTGACINLASDLGSIAGEDAKKRIKKQTFAIDANGGTSSELLLTLKRYMVDQTGAALASGTVVSIGGVNYTCGAGGVITHSINGKVDDTLHAFVARINTFAGFKASILHALTTQDTGSADYIDAAETVLPEAAFGGIATLFRDASAHHVSALRLGLPRANDRDPLKLLKIAGKATGATAGTVKLIRDDDAEFVADGSHQEAYLNETLTGAQTSYIDDNVLECQTIRGPVVLIVASSDLSAADFAIHYKQGLVK